MRAIPRIPLNSLRVFRVVAEQASFTAAAAILEMTQAGVSAAVRNLERYIGTPLFERGARSLALTPRGQLLLEAITPALDQVRSALFLLRGEHSDRALTVTVLPSFMHRWLLPRLARLLEARRPSLLRFMTHRDVLPLSADRIHAAIRYGLGNWPGLRAEKLFDDWLLPVASPSYLEARGLPRSPREMAKHRLIECPTEPWQVWIAAQPGRQRLPEAELVIDDSSLVVLAAEESQGIAMARWSMAQAAVSEGRLAQLPTAPVRDRYGYYLAWPPELTEVPHFRRFRDWISAESRAFPQPYGRPAGR